MHLLDPAHVLQLAMIAAQLSGYSMPDGQPPRVFEVTEAEMKAQCGSCFNYVGSYFDGGDIFIDEEWINSKENGNDVAHNTIDNVTVHELTHWLQYKHAWGGSEPCEHRQARENQAYMVQDRYIAKYEPDNKILLVPPDLCK